MYVRSEYDADLPIEKSIDATMEITIGIIKTINGVTVCWTHIKQFNKKKIVVSARVCVL